MNVNFLIIARAFDESNARGVYDEQLANQMWFSAQNNLDIDKQCRVLSLLAKYWDIEKFKNIHLAWYLKNGNLLFDHLPDKDNQAKWLNQIAVDFIDTLSEHQKIHYFSTLQHDTLWSNDLIEKVKELPALNRCQIAKILLKKFVATMTMDGFKGRDNFIQICTNLACDPAGLFVYGYQHGLFNKYEAEVMFWFSTKHPRLFDSAAILSDLNGHPLPKTWTSRSNGTPHLDFISIAILATQENLLCPTTKLEALRQNPISLDTLDTVNLI